MARRDGNKQARGRQPQCKGPKGARPARRKERTLRASDYIPASAAGNGPGLMLSDRTLDSGRVPRQSVFDNLCDLRKHKGVTRWVPLC